MILSRIIWTLECQVRAKQKETRRSRGIISCYFSIFQEQIASPVKSELHVIQEQIADGSDWLICSAECLTNSKWSHDKTCQSELSAIRSWGPSIRSWGPAIRSWGITLAGMFFLTYSIAYRTSITEMDAVENGASFKRSQFQFDWKINKNEMARLSSTNESPRATGKMRHYI